MDGEQLVCKYTTSVVKIRHTNAIVELTFRYACDVQGVEYYFPMCEVGRITSLQVLWKQGGATAELKQMKGSLYEQTPDGITRPWVDEEEDDNNSETQSLLGSWFSSTESAEAKKKKDADRPFYYFFGTSPELMELTPGHDLVIKVIYVVSCRVEKQKFEEKDLVTFVMPLTIFNNPPDRWDIQIEMPEFIRRVTPKLNTQKIWPEITGRRATIRFSDHYTLPLEDEYLILQTELGEPIEPRCADPVALFIFATFIGLMVWFSLTKDLH
eukprot:TRINITY_DN8363_c0_g1_i2.p1 TRINITY_DN8363_c0_g1~~TRINITY_DN8363_c0_g1_i2.p1  ORF type:complete len:316 (+),score=121.45 TRINITY_DN8363_c0_g1_i2:142-948(+)